MFRQVIPAALVVIIAAIFIGRTTIDLTSAPHITIERPGLFWGFIVFAAFLIANTIPACRDWFASLLPEPFVDWYLERNPDIVDRAAQAQADRMIAAAREAFPGQDIDFAVFITPVPGAPSRRDVRIEAGVVRPAKLDQVPITFTTGRVVDPESLDNSVERPGVSDDRRRLHSFLISVGQRHPNTTAEDHEAGPPWPCRDCGRKGGDDIEACSRMDCRHPDWIGTEAAARDQFDDAFLKVVQADPRVDVVADGRRPQAPGWAIIPSDSPFADRRFRTWITIVLGMFVAVTVLILGIALKGGSSPAQVRAGRVLLKRIDGADAGGGADLGAIPVRRPRARQITPQALQAPPVRSTLDVAPVGKPTRVFSVVVADAQRVEAIVVDSLTWINVAPGQFVTINRAQ